jgi:hypothetical protein
MLDESFTSLFPLSYDRQPSYLGSSSRSSSSNGVTHAVDAKYTGHMTVSGYNVSYVMPREFPPLEERNSQSAHSSAKHKRRSSVGERGAYQYLIAITMLVPFLSIPPRAPFMVCIVSAVIPTLIYVVAIYTSAKMSLEQHQTTNIYSQSKNVRVICFDLVE